MESAGILAAARELQVSTLALKVVSDTANSEIAGYRREFNSNMERLGKYLRQMIRVISTP
jgi:nucleoside phosphorylase